MFRKKLYVFQKEYIWVWFEYVFREKKFENCNCDLRRFPNETDYGFNNDEIIR